MRTKLTSLLHLIGLQVQGDIDGVTCYRSARKPLIWYLKAPPTKPPSDLQIWQRQRWTDILQDWLDFSDAARLAWMRLATLGHLRIHGLNLYIWWRCSEDDSIIQTLERQTGISVLSWSAPNSPA